MRKASPTLCTARLCYAIVSKVHWPPSTANHKTREREKKGGQSCCKQDFAPLLQVRQQLGVGSLIYVHISYSILKPREKIGGKKCALSMSHEGNACQKLDFTYYTTISSPGVCHIRLATNKVQTLFFASRTATNLMHIHIHELKEFFRHCTQYRFNLNISVAHWQFSVGTQRLCALVINNLVFFFGKPRCSGHRTLDGFQLLSRTRFQHFK